MPRILSALAALSAATALAHSGLVADVERLTAELDQRPTAALYLKRATKLRQLERYEEALADVRRAEAQNATPTEVAYERGITLAEQGRPTEALAVLDRYLALGGRSFNVHRWRGRQLAALGRNAEALIDFQQAFTLGPDPETCLELARFQAAHGWPVDARATLEQGLTRLSGAVTIRHELIALLRKTDPRAAVEQARRAMENQQVKAEWRILAAEILLEQKKPDAARVELFAARDELDALLAKRASGLHRQARARVDELLKRGKP